MPAFEDTGRDLSDPLQKPQVFLELFGRVPIIARSAADENGWQVHSILCTHIGRNVAAVNDQPVAVECACCAIGHGGAFWEAADHQPPNRPQLLEHATDICEA